MPHPTNKDSYPNNDDTSHFWNKDDGLAITSQGQGFVDDYKKDRASRNTTYNTRDSKAGNIGETKHIATQLDRTKLATTTKSTAQSSSKDTSSKK